MTVIQLQAQQEEQFPLLQYLYSKRAKKKAKKEKLQHVKKIIEKCTLTDEAQVYIVKKMKMKDLQKYESLLWDTGERLNYLPSKILPFLEKKDPKRVKKLLKEYKAFQEKQARETIIKGYTKLLKSEQYSNKRNTLDREIYSAIETLNTLNITSNIFKEKEVVISRIDAYLKHTKAMPLTLDAYLHFFMKNSSKIEQKILHTKN